MKRKRNILFLLIITVSLTSNTFKVFAQSDNSVINVVANRNQVLIGEPVELKVHVQLSVATPITELFNLPDTFNTLEVLHRGPLDSSLESSIKTYTQSFTITGFDSGTWAVPPLVLRSGDQEYASSPLDITIIPAAISADSTYHDIREIIEVKEIPTPWWYWVAAVLSAALLGLLIFLWIKSRKKKPAGEITTHVDPGALQDALNKLKQLDLQKLPEKQEWKKYYSTLTGIVKGYIEKKWGRPASSFTTDELLVFADGFLLKEKTGMLAESLRIADAVKFAKYQPELLQAGTDIKNIEEVIRQMDRKKD